VGQDQEHVQVIARATVRTITEGLAKRWPLLVCDGMQTMVEGTMGYATVRAERYVPF